MNPRPPTPHLTQVEPLGGDAQSLRELVGFELLLDVALHPDLVRAALLDDADEQDVVLDAPRLPLSEPVLARRTPGGQRAPDAPPAEGVSAGHGHRLGHQEQTNGTLQQIHAFVCLFLVCVCVCVMSQQCFSRQSSADVKKKKKKVSLCNSPAWTM